MTEPTSTLSSLFGSYKSVADLYVSGRTYVADNGQPIWVQALNAFDANQAKTDARARQATAVLAFEQNGQREVAEAKYLREGREGATLVMVNDKGPRFAMEAWQEIQGDEAWTEKLLAVQVGEAQVDGMSTAEKAAWAELNIELLVHLDALTNARRDKEADRLNALDEAELKRRYIKNHIDAEAMTISQDEYLVTQMWLACRVCSGVPTPRSLADLKLMGWTPDESLPVEVQVLRHPTTAWDHSQCNNHQDLFFGSRSDKSSREIIKTLPDRLFQELMATYGQISMSEDAARKALRRLSS